VAERKLSDTLQAGKERKMASLVSQVVRVRPPRARVDADSNQSQASQERDLRNNLAVLLADRVRFCSELLLS